MTAETLMAALSVEARKALASRVLWTTGALLAVGIVALACSLTLAVMAGNPQVISQLGPLGDLEGWPLLIGGVTQITAAAAPLGFGVAAGWMMGREFAEGTISALFALPVARTVIATAKLLVLLAWTLVVAAVLVVVTGLAGIVVTTGAVDAAAAMALARLFVLAALSGLLAFPAAWASTLGRGILPGIATSIVLVVITQIAVISGGGGWLPFAAPALWAMDPASVPSVQLALVAVVPAIFAGLIVLAWKRLQLDR